MPCSPEVETLAREMYEASGVRTKTWADFPEYLKDIWRRAAAEELTKDLV